MALDLAMRDCKRLHLPGPHMCSTIQISTTNPDTIEARQSRLVQPGTLGRSMPLLPSLGLLGSAEPMAPPVAAGASSATDGEETQTGGRRISQGVNRGNVPRKHPARLATQRLHGATLEASGRRKLKSK